MILPTTIDGQPLEPATPKGDNVLGPYLSEFPKNSFNNSNRVLTLDNNQNLPQSASGTYDWIYKPATREIRLDAPGTDKDNTRYYDY